MNNDENVTAEVVANVVDTGSLLEMELIGILQGVVSGVSDSKEFIMAELPDVVVQTLNWYGIYNFLLFLTSLLVFWGIWYFIHKFTGVGEKFGVDSYRPYKVTFTHNSKGEIDGHIILTALAILAVSFLGVTLINLQWLKIWIAPKLWLIEYTANLVK